MPGILSAKLWRCSSIIGILLPNLWLNNRSPGAVAGRILASCLKVKPGAGICLSAHLGEDRRAFSAITRVLILIIIIPHLWLELAPTHWQPNRHQITSGPKPGNSTRLTLFHVTTNKITVLVLFIAHILKHDSTATWWVFLKRKMSIV